LIKITLLFFSFFVAFALQAQQQNKVSDAFPFGKIHPDAPEALADFAPMIGICDCKSVQRNKQGVFQDTIDAVWQFKYILNGMAIQDETWKADGSTTSSIRQYNSDILKWYVTFFSSNQANPSPSTWSGTKNEKGDVVLYLPQEAPNGMEGFSRLTFYNISEKGFDWIGEWVDTKETFSYPFWEIKCKKRKNKQDD